MGWAVRPEQIRFRGDARYPAIIEDIGERRAGQLALRLRIGELVMRAVADPGDKLEPGSCRVDIDPGAVQVWRMDEER